VNLSCRIEAPGKLILIGEYAVRHAGPAVVMAVDRTAVLSACNGDSSPGGLVDYARRECARLLDREPSEVACRVDSSQFYDQGDKLGLGSSAAVVATSVASVFCEAGIDIEGRDERMRLWSMAHRIHNGFQGVEGSGIDLAASIFGGLLAIDRGRAPFGVRPWQGPADLRWVFAWSGQPASTACLVEAADRYQRADPLGYQDIIDEMIAVADEVVNPQAKPAARILALIDRYGGLMEQLGKRAAAPIVNDPVRKLMDAARSLGGAAKPSGAGGGDFVLAAFDQPDACAVYRERVQSLGAVPMDFRVQQRGVHLCPEEGAEVLSALEGQVP
jgi:phosphomevalonate kinase